MPTISITIRIEVPDDAEVTIERDDDAPAPDVVAEAEAPSSQPVLSAEVERYWRVYLSDNGRELYGAAAAIERESGPGYTLNDIASRMGREYAGAQSIHRTTGRSARKWHDDTGTDAPIQLVWLDYDWVEAEGGMRTSYRLPVGVAELTGRF